MPAQFILRKTVCVILCCALLPACAITHEVAQKTTIDRLELADKAFKAEDFGEAEKHYERIITESPDLILPYFRLGLIAYQHGDLEKAADYYSRILKQDPSHAPGIYNAAIIRLEQARRLLHQYEQAAPREAAMTPLIELRRAIEALRGNPSHEG